MPRRKVSKRRQRGRRGGSLTWYQCQGNVDGGDGYAVFHPQNLDIPINRSVRVEIAKFTVVQPKSVGICFQMAIVNLESTSVESPDYTSVSNTFMVSAIPRTFTIHNTPSADFGFIGKDLKASMFVVKFLNAAVISQKQPLFFTLRLGLRMQSNWARLQGITLLPELNVNLTATSSASLSESFSHLTIPDSDEPPDTLPFH